MKFVENFSEVKKTQPKALRPMFRKIALDLLAVSKQYRLTNSLQTPRIQFIYIHHVFRDEQSALRRLLHELSKDHVFISHSEACLRVKNGAIDKPYVTFSSDDGFKNNMYAADIFDEFGVKACFFICPGMIEEKSPEKISTFCEDRLHLPPVEFMDWHDVDQLLKRGHEIGSHTMSHVRVSQLSEPELETEIREAYRIIEKYCGIAEHFAFPYGRFGDFNEAGRKLVFESGHTSCASAERGCVLEPFSQYRQDQILLRRDHVILDWPLAHIMYFLQRNVENGNFHSVDYPYDAHHYSNQ